VSLCFLVQISGMIQASEAMFYFHHRAHRAHRGKKLKLINQITDIIIGSSISVHRELGPGLIESTYEACLAFELADRGLSVERQKALPVVYREVKLDCGYRIDLLVEKKVIIELKAVEQIDPIHTAQLLSYLKLSGCKLGLLINFNVKIVKNGIRRLIND